MNVSMHEVEMVDSYVTDNREHAIAHIRERGDRAGTASLFFRCADDCRAMAVQLYELAEQIREHENQASMEDESNERG